MTRRVYESSSVVSVSKPGIDVLSPTGISYDWLAMDSRLDGIRPLMLSHATTTMGAKIPYGQTFAKTPFVDIIGQGEYLVYKDANSSGYFLRSSYYLVLQKDGFYITDDQTYNRPATLNGSFTVCYIVWERLS